MQKYTWSDLNPVNWPRKKNIALAIDMILGWLCWLYWLKWLGLAYCCFALFTAFFPLTVELMPFNNNLVILGVRYHWCRFCSGHFVSFCLLNLTLDIHLPSSPKKQHYEHNDDLPDHPAGTDI